MIYFLFDLFTFYTIMITMQLCFCRIFELKYSFKKTLFVILAILIPAGAAVSVLDVLYVSPYLDTITAAVISYGALSLVFIGAVPPFFLFRAKLYKKLFVLLIFFGLFFLNNVLVQAAFTYLGIEEAPLAENIVGPVQSLTLVIIDIFTMAGVTAIFARANKNAVGLTLNYFLFTAVQFIATTIVTGLSLSFYSDRHSMIIGICIVLTAVLYVMSDFFLLRSVKKNSQTALLKAQNEEIKRKQLEQRRFYEALADQESRLSRLRHDSINHLQTLSILVSDGYLSRAQEYLSELISAQSEPLPEAPERETH